MLKLLYLAELVNINLKYIASNASVMMSLSVGYPQISASGYPDGKVTIRFSPSLCTMHCMLYVLHYHSTVTEQFQSWCLQ